MSPRGPSRLRVGLDKLLFVSLFAVVLSLLGWLSTRYEVHLDWTAAARNSLSEASCKVLAAIDGPVTITSFSSFTVESAPVREKIRQIADRYHRAKPDLRFSFVNTSLEPERARELGIRADGELLIEYQDRSERLTRISEQEISNALQRLLLPGQRWIVFVSGHGERDPLGLANHDLGDLAEQLRSKGLTVQPLDLSAAMTMPDNAQVLVIAGSRLAWLPGEVELILKHLARGGNLLWLADPGELHGLAPLAEALSVRFLPGVVVDAATRLFGIDDPSMALVSEYPPHPINEGLSAPALFPRAVGLESGRGKGWTATPVLATLKRSWTETGPVDGTIRFDAGGNECAGPITIGLALTRGAQRAVVIGDGDFLSNRFLGNGSNLDLGLSVLRWLSEDERLVDIPVRSAPDRSLSLSRAASLIIVFGFLIVLPFTFLATGAWIWWRRRSR